MWRRAQSIAIALAFFIPLVTYASDVRTDFKGEFIQGGLVVGETSEKAKVYLDGERIPVYPYGPKKDANGRFYLGFERDAPADAVLKILYADGATEQVRLNVKQREYDIQKLTLPEKMVTPPKKVEKQIAEDNRVINKARKKISEPCYFGGSFLKPAEGEISGFYGSQRILNDKPKNPHMGMDIAAKKGSAIVAPEDGTIRMVRDMYYTGNTVLIDHGCGVNTVYAHMSKVDVKEGQKVKRGEKIGLVGATGRATGPHLHWGLNLENLRLDPQLVTP